MNHWGVEMDEWITDKAKELARVLGITEPSSIHLLESNMDMAWTKGKFDLLLEQADKLHQEARNDVCDRTA